MHPSLWTASSTNTIKRDSFRSKSSSSGLNSLYTTFNIQEPLRNCRENGPECRKREAVFTLESLFDSSQNTSMDGGSIGTDVSGRSSDWCNRKSESFMIGRHSDRKRRQSDATYRFANTANYRRHNRFRVTSNSQTIHNINSFSNNYHTISTNTRTNARPFVTTPSSGSIGSPLTSVSLPKLQCDPESESIPEESNSELYDDIPYDLRSTASISLDSRKRNFDTMSISTTTSGIRLVSLLLGKN